MDLVLVVLELPLQVQQLLIRELPRDLSLVGEEALEI